jgi:hypothetical protein
MLGRHPDVFSFPESHYFRKTWGRLWRHRSWGLVSPRAAARSLDSLLAAVEWTGARPRIPRACPFFAPYGRAFSAVVDDAARARDRDTWVEKSPGHLHCIEEIRRWVPEARFIHLVRDGRDVVASLFELGITHPSPWVGQLIPKNRRRAGSAPAPEALLDAAIERWNADVGLSLARRGEAGHLVLHYGRLVRDPAIELQRACALLGLGFDDGMLRHWEAAAAVVGWRAEAPYMRKPFGPLEDNHLDRFGRIFDRSRQARIQERLWNGGDVEALEAPSLA